MMYRIFTLGDLQSNSYVIYNDKQEGVIFDIGGEDIEDLLEFIDVKKIKIKSIILTHGHLDHIKGLNKVIEIFSDAGIYIGAEDFDCFYDSVLNLSAYVGRNYFELNLENTSDRLNRIRENDEIFGFKVIDTPGHTIGSKCFYNDDAKIIVTGDTLFKDSVGRTDLPTGSTNLLKKSIEKILKYDENIVVLPGHGPITKIKNEQKSKNYFEESYVRHKH